jgi:hypothetical protein
VDGSNRTRRDAGIQKTWQQGVLAEQVAQQLNRARSEASSPPNQR